MLDTKLETLLVLQKEQNFTKASTRLGITQPAVSTHIKQLEEELGCKLIIRSRNDVKPTEKGEIVIGYAKRLKSLYQKMVEELNSDSQSPIKIKIGIANTIEDCTIVKVLGKYSANNDSISLTVVTDTACNLSSQLEDYELDLIVVEDKITRPDLSCSSLGNDELMAIVSTANPLSGTNEITLEQLKAQKLILRLPSSNTRMLLETALAEKGEKLSNFNLMLEVDSINTIKNLVEQNVGITVLPKSNCKDIINRGVAKALPIKDLKAANETHLVYLSDFSHKAVISDILSIYSDLSK